MSIYHTMRDTTAVSALQPAAGQPIQDSSIPLVHSNILSAVGHTPLVRLHKLFAHSDCRLYAKLEAVNPGGSIKDRTARQIVLAALAAGDIQPGDTIIESSSGNMAVGLAQACRYLELNLIVVVDPNVNQQTVRILEAYGTCIEYVSKPDPVEGFLGARIKRVHQLLRTIPNSFWSNQYGNPHNPGAHYETMAEIVTALDGELDYLFVATSTCGTIMGCAQYIEEHQLSTQLVAVDAVGSVIFGTPAAKRLIPGHGAGRPSKLLQQDQIDDVVHVTDWDCVQGCRWLLDREAILAGGSSGGVITAVFSKLPTLPANATVAVILCDRGERYLDTIYSDSWLSQHFSDKQLRPLGPQPAY